MFATSGDILNMSLAIGFIVLVVFLSVLILYTIIILRDVTKVVDDVTEITHRVHSTIVEPLRAIDFLVEKVRPYIEMAVEKRNKAASKKKKS